MLIRKLVTMAVVGFVLPKVAAIVTPHLMAGLTYAGKKGRPAGANHMNEPPRSWDMVDERADASFPASDPPGTY